MCQYLVLTSTTPHQYVSRLNPLTLVNTIDEATYYEDNLIAGLLYSLNLNDEGRTFESTPGGVKPPKPPSGG